MLNAHLHFIAIVTLTFHTLASCIEVPETRGEFIDCPRSRIDYNVTLSEGHAAGTFLKANKSVQTMKRCLKQCCQMKGCDVAFFNNGACYSVKCKTIDSCAPTMNTDKKMNIAISFVAKPKVSLAPVHRDSNVELEVTDNFIAEVTPESPFVIDDANEDVNSLNQLNSESWREAKDIVIAIGCGFVAVIVGVGGVVIMTKKLVEDDDEIYSNVNSNEKCNAENQEDSEAIITGDEHLKLSNLEEERTSNIDNDVQNVKIDRDQNK